VPTPEVEARLVEAGRSWSDDLQEALISMLGEERGIERYRRYADAFPLGYRERFAAAVAVQDVARTEDTLEKGRMGINLYRPVEAGAEEIRLKIYNTGKQVALSDILPMLEHMGLKVISEIPYAVQPMGRGTVWIHDFTMITSDGREIDVSRVRQAFEEALIRVWLGEMEDDGFNKLVLRASLTWRKVLVLRAYCKFLRQTGIAFSQSYMEETLANNPKIARALVQLFRTRFASDLSDRDTLQRGIVVEIEHGLDAVANLDEDRILRRFLNLILCTLRTNFYQTGADGRPKPYLSLKLDSRQIDELPLPRPMVEIFVYSPRGASTWRQGRARRHPLVGPTRGFPHRGARADEGADGEKRRHCAGGLERRIRGQTSAHRWQPRGAERRSGRVLSHDDARPSRHHRQSRRRRRGAAAKCGPARR
jgi:glutamate dehydrogenase